MNSLLTLAKDLEQKSKAQQQTTGEMLKAAFRGGKREPQKIPPFRIVEFFGGVVRGMTTRQRLPHLSEALWRDAETPGNSATPVPGPQ
uniref:MbeB family mobilization protein n=1 Tax=Citrobacter freundii TaxID=546 RepID=UPI003D8168C9